MTTLADFRKANATYYGDTGYFPARCKMHPNTLCGLIDSDPTQSFHKDFETGKVYIAGAEIIQDPTLPEDELRFEGVRTLGRIRYIDSVEGVS